MTKAEADCWAAWVAAPNATWAWCCHHGVRLEPIIKPLGERINYIRDYKPRDEQESRFNNFRPVLSPLPPKLLVIAAAYVASQDQSAYGPVWASYGAYIQASEALYLAKAAYATTRECSEAHLRDVPGHTWNGVDIF